jgi:hypothetical protein
MGTTDATASASNPAATSPEAELFDDSKYSSLKELERWAPLVAGLPPEQREQNLPDHGRLKGRDLATCPGKKFDAANISNWVKNQTPTNGCELTGMLNDAATPNAVSGTDISKLGKDGPRRQPADGCASPTSEISVKAVLWSRKSRRRSTLVNQRYTERRTHQTLYLMPT